MRRDALALLRETASSANLDRAVTFSGVIFDSSADAWAYSDGTHDVRIDHTVFDWMHPRLADGIRRILLLRVQKDAPASVMSYFKAFVYFSNHLKIRWNGLSQAEQVLGRGLPQLSRPRMHVAPPR